VLTQRERFCPVHLAVLVPCQQVLQVHRAQKDTQLAIRDAPVACSRQAGSTRALAPWGTPAKDTSLRNSLQPHGWHGLAAGGAAGCVAGGARRLGSADKGVGPAGSQW
jgi:hypothetical protein